MPEQFGKESTLSPETQQGVEYLRQIVENLPDDSVRDSVTSLLKTAEAMSMGVSADWLRTQLCSRETSSAFETIYNQKIDFCQILVDVGKHGLDAQKLIMAITGVRSGLDQVVRKAGVQMISPEKGEKFDSSKQETPEKMTVWVNTNPELHNTIHSVITPGFIGPDGQVWRQARVKKYLYDTDSIEPAPIQSQTKPAPAPAPAPKPEPASQPITEYGDWDDLDAAANPDMSK